MMLGYTYIIPEDNSHGKKNFILYLDLCFIDIIIL